MDEYHKCISNGRPVDAKGQAIIMEDLPEPHQDQEPSSSIVLTETPVDPAHSEDHSLNEEQNTPIMEEMDLETEDPVSSGPSDYQNQVSTPSGPIFSGKSEDASCQHSMQQVCVCIFGLKLKILCFSRIQCLVHVYFQT